MAIFIGTPGGYMKEKSLKRRWAAFMAFMLFVILGTFLLGWFSGYAFGHRTMLSGMLAVVAVVFGVSSLKVLGKLSDEQLRESRKEEKGADGERDFVMYLRDLPDTYTVISDLDFADSYGNIDHLIIGPTGVFAIDVKAWKGTVTSDGKGELMSNGKSTDKPQVRYFTRRTMDLKDRIKALTKLEPYIQCVFAFMHTHVDAKWGTTGSVHCIRAEQIVDYITKARVKKPFSPADLARLVSAAQALQSLAGKTKASAADTP